MKKTLGGDRLGSGNKMQVSLHGYSRSSHDQTSVFKSDQAVGTLVPYYCNIGTNGDTFYIDLETIVRTLPTNGPIFDTMKHQIDVFKIPIRLYNAALHNNALNIGRNMERVKFPVAEIPYTDGANGDRKRQFGTSSLFAYTGLKGLPTWVSGEKPKSFYKQDLFRLAYWDIFKNYYSNKQEEIGYVIGNNSLNIQLFEQIILADSQSEIIFLRNSKGEFEAQETVSDMPRSGDTIDIAIMLTQAADALTTEQIKREIDNIEILGGVFGEKTKMSEIIESLSIDINSGVANGEIVQDPISFAQGDAVFKENTEESVQGLIEFSLSNIDEMREKILAAPSSSPFVTTSLGLTPYNTGLEIITDKKGTKLSASGSQVGLAVRTYLSDRFNNWLSTEFIDGENGVNEISAVDVSDGKLTMDALNFAEKLYELSNRIAISDGSYYGWQEAAYGERVLQMDESPIYVGGMASEVLFDEVVSTAEAETDGGVQPLGSLAGRGITRYNKGGHQIKVRCTEPTMIMVIGSFVPRIGYSQGNKWWTRLETMADLHVPGLDGIGFQELLTEEMVATATEIIDGEKKTYSAGKQPAYIELMTDVNENYGSFAAGEPLNFMVFDRNYETLNGQITDLTTYVDPVKYNYAFADTTIEAMNLWVQCEIKCIARRKMSAVQIPNL